MILFVAGFITSSLLGFSIRMICSEWLAETPAYKTGGNDDGYQRHRRGSNMRDDQSK